MRRLLAASLTVVLAAVLCGCGPSAKDNIPSAPPVSGKAPRPPMKGEIPKPGEANTGKGASAEP
jgi:hypothetical protein